MLVDAYRLEKLQDDKDMIDGLLQASWMGLGAITGSGEIGSRRGPGSADYRLAFRELGLSIGLHAASRMDNNNKAKRLVGKYGKLADDIETFWLNPKHQATNTFQDYLDINEVMLATSLDPDGFLGE